jgi:hypothetical protein
MTDRQMDAHWTNCDHESSQCHFVAGELNRATSKQCCCFFVVFFFFGGGGYFVVNVKLEK